MRYSLYTKFFEKIQNKKVFIVSLVCLIFAYVFTTIFLGTYLSYEKRMKNSINSIKLNETSSIFWDSENSKFLEFDKLKFEGFSYLPSLAETYLEHNGKKIRLLSKVIDKNINRFLDFNDLSKDKFDSFFDKAENILIQKKFADLNSIKEGDSLYINGEKYNCYAILEKEIFNFSSFPVIFNKKVKKGRNFSVLYHYVYIEKNKKDDFINELRNVTVARNDFISENFDDIKQRYISRISDAKKESLKLTGIFLFLTISSMYLVIFANIKISRKSISIKASLGESRLLFWISETTFNILFSFLAYNLSIVFYLLIRKKLPSFLYLDLNFEIYSIIAFLSILISLIISFINIGILRKKKA